MSASTTTCGPSRIRLDMMSLLTGAAACPAAPRQPTYCRGITKRELVYGAMDVKRFRDMVQLRDILKDECLQPSQIRKAIEGLMAAGRIESDEGRPRWRRAQ